MSKLLVVAAFLVGAVLEADAAAPEERRCKGVNEEFILCPIRLSDRCPARPGMMVQASPSTPPYRPCYPSTCMCETNHCRANGTCIHIRDMPPFDCPDKLTQFDACPERCPSDDCRFTNPLEPCPYNQFLFCNPSCRCKPGTYRLHGDCVPPEQCPPFPCPGPHEHHESCPEDCPTDECKYFDSGAMCPPKEKSICRPSCRCDPHYYRLRPGSECIHETHCPAHIPVLPED